MNNLKQIYTGLALYAQDNDDYIPATQGGTYSQWFLYLGYGGYVGGSKSGPPWPVLQCPAEYQYTSNNGVKKSNYTYNGCSYAINWAFGNYLYLYVGVIHELPLPD